MGCSSSTSAQNVSCNFLITFLFLARRVRLHTFLINILVVLKTIPMPEKVKEWSMINIKECMSKLMMKEKKDQNLYFILLILQDFFEVLEAG